MEAAQLYKEENDDDKVWASTTPRIMSLAAYLESYMKEQHMQQPLQEHACCLWHSTLLWVLS